MTLAVKINFLLIPAFLFFSCTGKKQNNYIKFNGLIQGTTYQVSYESISHKNYKPEIENLLSGFDSSLSLYKDYSIVSRINNNKKNVNLNDYFITAFYKSLEINKLTNGAFDITVGPLVNAWGFGPDEIRNIDSAKVNELLQLVGMHHIEIKEGFLMKDNPDVKLDFNAIAQGYSVDVTCDFLDKKGIKNYLVEIGGEIKTKGKNDKGKTWRIGIDKPFENMLQERDLQAIVELNNKSLATSGNYRKFYEENGIKYSHTINPKTGFPERTNLLSVTVIMDNCIDADAFATAFMVMGLDKSYGFASNNPNMEAYFIYGSQEGEFKVKMTDGFKNLIVE